MLKLNNISKTVKSGNTTETILDHASLQINPDEFSVIIGKSGSGKSTLLNILSGLDQDYSGKITYGNTEISNKNRDHYRSNEIGFVFQNFNLIAHLSVLENIILPLDLMVSMTKKQKRDEALKILEELEISELADKSIKNLSGGERQRVAIARALINKPKIIVADEPTGSLDEKNTQVIMRLFKKIAENGTSVIVVSHDLTFTEYADKVYKMSDGKLELEQDLAENRNEASNDDITIPKSKSLPLLSLIRHSFKNFLSRKKRNIFISIGTAIGIIALMLSFALNMGVSQGVESFMDDLNPSNVNIYHDLSGTGAGNPSVPMTDAEIEEAESFFDSAGIEAIYPSLYVYGEAITFDGNEVVNTNENIIILEEATFDADNYSNFYHSSEILIAGTTLEEGEAGMILTSSIAKQLLGYETYENAGEEEYEKLVGQDITIDYYINDNGSSINYSEEVPVSGIMSSERETMMTNIVVTEQTMGMLTEEKGYSKDTYVVNGVASSPSESAEIVSEYQGEDIFEEKLLITNTQEFLDMILNILQIVVIVLAFMSILSLIVSGVMIFIVLSMAIIERTKEIGVMRAIGFKAKNIKLIFIMESVIIVLLSNIIAGLIAIIIGSVMNPFMSTFTGLDNVFDFSAGTFLYTLAITLFITILFSYLPARKASKLNIVEALNYE